MADILLIKPPEIQGYLGCPPLGLCYLAAACEKSGFSVEIFDMAMENIGHKGIQKRIFISKPKVIGIYVSSTGLTLIPPLIENIRSVIPLVKVVVGGPHISACPDVVNLLDVAYGFTGDAEIGFPKLCRFLIDKSGDLRNIEGLVWKNEQALCLNPTQKGVNIDSFVFPARHLLPLDKYFNPWFGGRTTSMITSRGCMFQCAYCSKSGELSYRSPDNIVEELKYVLRHLSVKYIEFVDDLFTFDHERVHKIVTSIMKEGIKFSWGCQTRADHIDKTLVEEMKAVGLRKISFGIETGSERIRYLLGKKITNNSYKKAIKLCKDFGLYCTGCFMIGLPGETSEEIEDTVNFCKELDLDVVLVSRLFLLPRTPLFIQAVKEGKIPFDAWEKCLMGKRDSIVLYIPDGLTERKVHNLFLRAYLSILFSPRMIRKKIKTLRSISQIILYLRILRKVIQYVLRRQILTLILKK